MMCKRAFDLTVTLLGSLVLLPVLTIVAVFVRLSSPGPVLFRQLRVGQEVARISFYSNSGR